MMYAIMDEELSILSIHESKEDAKSELRENESIVEIVEEQDNNSLKEDYSVAYHQRWDDIESCLDEIGI